MQVSIFVYTPTLFFVIARFWKSTKDKNVDFELYLAIVLFVLNWYLWLWFFNAATKLIYNRTKREKVKFFKTNSSRWSLPNIFRLTSLRNGASSISRTKRWKACSIMLWKGSHRVKVRIIVIIESFTFNNRNPKNWKETLLKVVVCNRNAFSSKTFFCSNLLQSISPKKWA